MTITATYPTKNGGEITIEAEDAKKFRNDFEILKKGGHLIENENISTPNHDVKTSNNASNPSQAAPETNDESTNNASKEADKNSNKSQNAQLVSGVLLAIAAAITTAAGGSALCVLALAIMAVALLLPKSKKDMKRVEKIASKSSTWAKVAGFVVIALAVALFATHWAGAAAFATVGIMMLSVLAAIAVVVGGIIVAAKTAQVASAAANKDSKEFDTLMEKDPLAKGIAKTFGIEHKDSPNKQTLINKDFSEVKPHQVPTLKVTNYKIDLLKTNNFAKTVPNINRDAINNEHQEHITYK